MSDDSDRITVHAQAQAGFPAEIFDEESAQIELRAAIASGEIDLETGVGPVDPPVKVVLQSDGLSVTLVRGEEVLNEDGAAWAEAEAGWQPAHRRPPPHHPDGLRMHLVTKTFDQEEQCPACRSRFNPLYALDEWYEMDQELICASCMLGILTDLDAEIVIPDSD